MGMALFSFWRQWMASQAAELGSISAVYQMRASNALITSITTDTNTDSINGCDNWDSAVFHVNVTATGGTSPTLDVTLQFLMPNASTWIDVGHATQLTTGANNAVIGVVNTGNIAFASA